MSTIIEYFQQAEFALAAYANLFAGMPDTDYINNLKNSGMTLTQAQTFAATWRVVDQYDGRVEETYVDEFGQEHTVLSPTGLSVTLFEDSSGKQVVAIRGTESSFPEWIADWATNIIDIGALGTAEHQAQYAALSAQVRTWLDDGILQPGFTATGHSLGGFLAANLTLEYAGDVAETYLYNAPGVAGLAGLAGDALLELIANALMPGKPFTLSPVASLHNIVATWDPASEIGISVAPPITIQIESNANPIHNHSIVTLTDSLAVYNLFATLDPSLSVEAIGGLLQTSSGSANTTLESALSALGAIFGKNYPATETSRDSFYANLYELEGVIAQMPGTGLTLEILGTTASDGTFTPYSPTAIKNLARTDIAYRYALINGNPFAVVGADYSTFNQNGELDLYNPATGQGQLSNIYLADRAEMLANLIYANANDTILTGSNVHYVDLEMNISLNELTGTQKIAFGSEQADLLEGTDPFLWSDNVVDRLYGGGGNDLTWSLAA